MSYSYDPTDPTIDHHQISKPPTDITSSNTKNSSDPSSILSGMDSRTIGILGGGQLGRMLVEAAHRLNIKTVVLDAANSPAKQINALHPHVDGSFSSAEDVKKLAEQCDVLTMEIEHVDTHILEELEKSGKEVQPGWKTIRTIQDKYLQKEDLMSRDVAVAESKAVEANVDALKAVGAEFGYPFMLKSRTMAYDGRGNYVVRSEGDVDKAVEALTGRPLYAEKWADFKMELAVMVVKQKDGTCLSYPTVETIHEDNICKLVYAPARNVDKTVRDKARALAEKAVSGYEGAGVFGVEMFLLKDGQTILVNEIAPRPHNSGHYTIETHATSQYEVHLRAILSLPIPRSAVEFRTPDTNGVMLNILGGPEPESHLEACKLALETAGATLHLYGKKEARKGRKMGHVTVVAGTMADAENSIRRLIRATEYTVPPPPPPKPSTMEKVAAVASSLTSFPSLSSQKQPPPHQTRGVGAYHDPSLPIPPSSIPNMTPVVAIIMGSDSDLPTMAPAARILQRFNVPFTLDIISAHRTPQKMFLFSSRAESLGYRVIIAGAGGAAHLPGMVASETVLPVIGVPVKASVLDGVDSLYSISQMPRGCPVATVGIGNATNAGLLAVRMLGVAEDRCRGDMKAYQDGMREEVEGKSGTMGEIGWESYLDRMMAEKK